VIQFILQKKNTLPVLLFTKEKNILKI